MTPRAFVTDGSYPNSLAAIRALARGGFHVTVGERQGVSLSETIGFWSRHCARRMRYPDPRIDRRAAAIALAEHFRNNAYDVALPVGLEMTSLFVEYRDVLPVRTMLPPAESFEVAGDKRKTFAHCEAAGVPVPVTVPAARWQEIGLPVVFKHYATGAVVTRTAEAAEACAAGLQGRIDDYVAQQYIPGENGFGYFGFFDRGREAGYFMHERLMQIPKEGGPSVVARAVRDGRLRDLGRTVLESLNWHGVAMVEFKRSDADGELYLMEINPKLWGSLDLAIQSGCNFPMWIADAVMGRSVPKEAPYRENVRYQWVVPNGLKCFLRYPEFRMPFLRNLVASDVQSDVRLTDPLPTAAALVAMAANWSKR